MRYALAVLLLVAVIAQARIRLVCPPPVPGSDNENQIPSTAFPCGGAMNFSDPSITFTALNPGRQTVMFLETAAVEDSPFSLRLCNRSGACSYVILDHIPHLNFGTQILRSAPATRFENRPFSIAVPFPNIQCDECFLQLIQVSREAYNSGDDCTFDAANTGTCRSGNTQFVACAAISLNGTNPWNPNPTSNGLDYSNRPGDWNPSNEGRGAGVYRQFAGNQANWQWDVNERNTVRYGYRINDGENAYGVPSGYCNRMFTTAEINYKSAFYNAADFTPSGGKASAASLTTVVPAAIGLIAALSALLL